MANNNLHDFINWQDYNQFIKKSGAVPLPQEDSKGDSADDQTEEAKMGNNYADTEIKKEELISTKIPWAY